MTKQNIIPATIMIIFGGLFLLLFYRLHKMTPPVYEYRLLELHGGEEYIGSNCQVYGNKVVFTMNGRTYSYLNADHLACIRKIVKPGINLLGQEVEEL